MGGIFKLCAYRVNFFVKKKADTYIDFNILILTSFRVQIVRFKWRFLPLKLCISAYQHMMDTKHATIQIMCLCINLAI
jgi:hypothetical protein